MAQIDDADIRDYEAEVANEIEKLESDQAVKEAAIILRTRDMSGTARLDWDVWEEQSNDDERLDALQTALGVVEHLREPQLTDAPILADVAAERDRQDAKWGMPTDHADGTGADSQPLALMGFYSPFAPAEHLAMAAKSVTDATFAGTESRVGTWADILLEEVFEALAEDDPAMLRAELIQVAAVAVKWARMIDARTGLPA